MRTVLLVAIFGSILLSSIVLNLIPYEGGVLIGYHYEHGEWIGWPFSCVQLRPPYSDALWKLDPDRHWAAIANGTIAVASATCACLRTRSLLPILPPKRLQLQLKTLLLLQLLVCILLALLASPSTRIYVAWMIGWPPQLFAMYCAAYFFIRMMSVKPPHRGTLRTWHRSISRPRFLR